MSTNGHTQLSFDGHGINDVDEYRTRIATFTNQYKDSKYGPLFAAAPEMLEALGRLRLEAIHYRDTGRGVQHLSNAIEQAEFTINKALPSREEV